MCSSESMFLQALACDIIVHVRAGIMKPSVIATASIAFCIFNALPIAQGQRTISGVSYAPENTCVGNVPPPGSRSTDDSGSRINIFDFYYSLGKDLLLEKSSRCLWGRNCGACCDVMNPAGIDNLDDACYRHDVCLREASTFC